MKIFRTPTREYVLIAVVALILLGDYVSGVFHPVLWIVASLGALPTLAEGFAGLFRRRITIEVFNSFAIVIAFAAQEVRSAAFIVLMLTSAAILEWRTETRATQAVEQLLKLKPSIARREQDGQVTEVSVEEVQRDDLLVVKPGDSVPVDGVVVYGQGLVNQASLTGESVPVAKAVGDTVLSSTVNESGAFRMRATNVGKDSTIERMARLIEHAAKNKSRSEKVADRFAGMFLPVVLLIGVVTFLVTRNIVMTGALFLVACADDMAVAIPLAVTASLGRAARRGVIVKGGEFFEAFAKIHTLVLDKTGTLTYGSLSLQSVEREPWVEEALFWRLLASAEKFSEHPMGRVVLHAALEHVHDAPDPDEFHSVKGSGVWARVGTDHVAVGDESLPAVLGSSVSADVLARLRDIRSRLQQTTMLVFVNDRFAGFLTVADVLRPEAKESLAALKRLGVQRIIMFTGDNAERAGVVSQQLGIDEFRAQMKPEDKLRELEQLASEGIVAMVGDGVNDAPALARANVGIAMGGGGTAVAVEAADVVMLTDDLERLPEMVSLARRTLSVIRADVGIWLSTNAIGFVLVLTGVAGLVFAALYNFLTDFLPMFNSLRLFRAVRIPGATERASVPRTETDLRS